MHTLIRRTAIVAGVSTTVLALGAGSALAHECVNPNKQAEAGAQVTFGAGDEPTSMHRGSSAESRRAWSTSSRGTAFTASSASTRTATGRPI